MRAVLVLMVMMAWAACLLGAVGCTAYLVARAVRTLPFRRGRTGRVATRPQQGVVTALLLFAIVMVAFAAALAGVVLWWGRTPGPLSSALAWAAMPMWAAVAAATTALVLWLSRRPTERTAEQ